MKYKAKPTEKEDEDPLQQSNKIHKGLRDKLKKKRKTEKDIKKKKREKKKEAELKKLRKKKRDEKKDANASSDEGEDFENSTEGKMMKYIKKLRIFMEEEADDLFEMFETIDAGGEVLIEELENTKVKNYLKKLFKYLGLKKNPQTKEYSQDPDRPREALKPRVQDMWYRGVDTSSSDSENGKGIKKQDEMEEEIIEEDEEKKFIDIQKAKDALLEGIDKLPETKKVIAEPEEEEIKEEPKRIKGEEWRSFLDEKFGSLVGDDKDGYSKLNKKAGAGVQDNRTEKDKKVDEFMQDYNSQFRRKSLLEEHQERKAAGLAAKGGMQERRLFDRDMDVTNSRVDSKRIFQMLNEKGNNLTSRFGNSNSGNKYL